MTPGPTQISSIPLIRQERIIFRPAQIGLLFLICQKIITHYPANAFGSIVPIYQPIITSKPA